MVRDRAILRQETSAFALSNRLRAPMMNIRGRLLSTSPSSIIDSLQTVSGLTHIGRTLRTEARITS